VLSIKVNDARCRVAQIMRSTVHVIVGDVQVVKAELRYFISTIACGWRNSIHAAMGMWKSPLQCDVHE
jgi:hypothetical protein